MKKVDEYKKMYQRKCSVLNAGGFRPTKNVLTSNFFLSPVARTDEDWPCYAGKPLPYICQLNLAEAPYVPEMLSDIALITFFIDLDSYLASHNNDAWCIRAYTATEGLVAMAPPPQAIRAKGFECQWEQCAADYPVYDDPELMGQDCFSDEELDQIMEVAAVDNIKRTKIGGWASNIQHEPYFDNPGAEFCLQIDSEAKVRLNWVDGGTIYIARNTAASSGEEWCIDIQFY